VAAREVEERVPLRAPAEVGDGGGRHCSARLSREIWIAEEEKASIGFGELRDFVLGFAQGSIRIAVIAKRNLIVVK
jgi:hypothetical protein